MKDSANSFNEPIETETDEFKRAVLKTLRKYATIMEDIFNNIEMFAILTSGFKDHSELLKNILAQLPEVKQNHKLQSYIQTAYDQFDERYKKQLESFTHHLDDLEKP